MKFRSLLPYLRWDFYLALLSVVIALGAALYGLRVPHPRHDFVSTLAVVLCTAIGFYLMGYQKGRQAQAAGQAE